MLAIWRKAPVRMGAALIRCKTMWLAMMVMPVRLMKAVAKASAWARRLFVTTRQVRFVWMANTEKYGSHKAPVKAISVHVHMCLTNSFALLVVIMVPVLSIRVWT
jgi:hypothetical protein